MPTRLPSTADAVILGGGVMGANTAYHLCKAGIKKVVLLEREPFFETGATGRCAGGIRYQFNTEINIRLSQISLPMLDARGGRNRNFSTDSKMRIPLCADS